MINNDVEVITKMNDEEQKTALRSFVRFSDKIRIDQMVTHRSLLHKLRESYKNISTETLSYCALIMAIQIYKNEQKSLKNLNINVLRMEEIRELTSKKAKMFLTKQFRKQTKRERLIGYWAVIKTLKNEENFSFRQIENYLKKHYKFEVAYSLIAKIWAELENKEQCNG